MSEGRDDGAASVQEGSKPYQEAMAPGCERFRFERLPRQIEGAAAAWRMKYLKQRGVKTPVLLIGTLAIAVMMFALIGMFASQQRVDAVAVSIAVVAMVIMLPLMWLVSRDLRRKAHEQMMRQVVMGELPLMTPGDGLLSFEPWGLLYCDKRASFMVSWEAGASLRQEGPMTWVVMGEQRMMGIPTHGWPPKDGLQDAMARLDDYPMGISRFKRLYFERQSYAYLGCGQELMGTVGNRCPECGRDVKVSELPAGWWSQARQAMVKSG